MQYDIHQLTRYIEKIFYIYRADRQGFFSYFDDEVDDYVDCELFGDTVDDNTINHLTIHLGLTKKEILSMDEEAAWKYWEKYPFFSLYRDFLDHCEWYAKYRDAKPSREEILLKAIFSTQESIYDDYSLRYDYEDVKSRLIEQLKEIDKAIPGTYHHSAEITKLTITTENFISFPKCIEMVRSFILMVKRLEELFFKTLYEELGEEEIHEMDFLASWLRATDYVMPSVKITYKNVCTYREVYIGEKYTDFFSYVKIRRFLEEKPWRCKEFFDDMELTQQYINIFPQAKQKMREFAMDVRKFHCWFTWSDAMPITYSDAEEEEMLELDRSGVLNLNYS